jgi:uncharacterized membrane protein
MKYFMNNQKISIVGLVAISFVLAAFFYPQMPQMMASHWGADGQVNGYMSKFWGLFSMPLILAAVAGLLLWLPKVDPLKKNIEQFKIYYGRLVILTAAFLLYVQILTIAWNLGARFDLGKFMIPALVVLFYYAGVMLGKTKRNWFVGIRTPWTIFSDAVWEKTNKRGGKIFKVFAIAGLVGLFFGSGFLLWWVIGLIAASIYLFFYSYLEFKKISK